jgi:hypothetical protein
LNSLQLQVGIIAACATSLKPLVRRVLRLPTSAYNNYEKYGNSRQPQNSVGLVTIGGTRGGPLNTLDSQNKRGRAADALDDGDSDRSNLCLTNPTGQNTSSATSDLFKQPKDKTASEELILPQQGARSDNKDESARTHPRGIMRRTEITVERVNS